MAERAQPTAVGHWKRALAGRDSSELLTLAERVEKLAADPTFIEVMDLLGQGREFVLDSLINGPTRDLAGYARQTGYAAGLDELTKVVQAIREVAQSREAKLSNRAEAERTGAQEDPSP